MFANPWTNPSMWLIGSHRRLGALATYSAVFTLLALTVGGYITYAHLGAAAMLHPKSRFWGTVHLGARAAGYIVLVTRKCAAAPCL